MTFGSLFTGIGGFDLGLERAGMTCVWQVEIDPFCRKVLAKHWPDVLRWSDVRDFNTSTYVDLICGGFPCQPVTIAGKRRGTNDDRWLWPEFARVIDMVRPRYVLVENVPNLLHVQFGSAMGEVLGTLASLGYDAEWDCLQAKDVGAPHKRERLFIVAHTREVGQPAAPNPISQEVRLDTDTDSAIVNLFSAEMHLYDWQRHTNQRWHRDECIPMTDEEVEAAKKESGESEHETIPANL